MWLRFKKKKKRKKQIKKKCLRAPQQLGGLLLKSKREKKNQSGTFVRSVQKVEPTAPTGRILQTNCVRDVSAVSEQQGTDGSAHVPCKVFLPPTDVTTGHGGQVLKLLSPGAGAAFEDLHGHHRQCHYTSSMTSMRMVLGPVRIRLLTVR